MVRLAKPRRVGHAPGEHSVYFYQARGVALVVAPWNFPLAILAGMTSAALVAGNTVVVKPAGPTPVVGAQLARILHEAGAPAGTVNYLSLIHISEPTRLGMISYAVFCLKKKNKK